MDHQERISLAQALCDRMVGKYGTDIIVGGLYGSTAAGLDLSSSDLEMLFVVGDGCKAEGRRLVYRGTPVFYSVTRSGELEQRLANPSLDGVFTWPFWMGVLSVLKVMHGEQAQVLSWLEIGRSVPDETLRQALERELPGLILESYGRILSCRERDNQDDLYCAVIEVLFEMKDALCLLNRRWVTHDYFQGLTDSFRFAKLPRSYRELVPRLWHASGFDEVVPMAEELVRDFWKLMAEEGIRLHNCKEASDIDV
jgi:hypothetical protein